MGSRIDLRYGSSAVSRRLTVVLKLEQLSLWFGSHFAQVRVKKSTVLSEFLQQLLP